MYRMQELLIKKNRLTEIMQMMDRDANFDTEEGRTYCHLLVKNTLIQLEIDQIKQRKKKTAR